MQHLCYFKSPPRKLPTAPADVLAVVCSGACLSDMVVPGKVGAINTLPVPLYTLTNPSPDNTEPTRLDVLFSVVNSNEDDHAIAILPSILITSLSSTNSNNSSRGTGDSNTQNPFPDKVKLNRPSPPKAAVAKLLRDTIDSFKFASQAKNNPSSNTMPPPQSEIFLLLYDYKWVQASYIQYH